MTDSDSSWDVLKAWGDCAERLEPLTGGVANDVWRIRLNGEIAVARLGTRSDADLDWETKLLQYLDQQGMLVPTPIPTLDGRLFVKGLVVMRFIKGVPPETQEDWHLVSQALQHLHTLTQGWPQRPGWRSSVDFCHENAGTKVDLNAMPVEGVARCRAAWARLSHYSPGRSHCVVHGDPNPGNVLMCDGKAALIDWDEAHLDLPELDLALPHNAAGLEPEYLDVAAQASAAWEAAVCWDDAYSKKRLSEVRALPEKR